MSQEKTKLVMICGLPGSGKTTLAKKLAEEMPAIRLCPDEWMEDLGVSLWEGSFRDKLEKRLWKFGQELLKLDQSVILEYGFWSRSERDEKLRDARLLNVGVELHYLKVSSEEFRKRLSKRGMEGDDTLVDKIDEHVEKIEEPNDAELRLYDNHN